MCEWCIDFELTRLTDVIGLGGFATQSISFACRIDCRTLCVYVDLMCRSITSMNISM
jgi:hypothetical protein